jgi:hypothetical protein
MDIFYKDYNMKLILFVRALRYFIIFEWFTFVILNCELFTIFYETAY